MVEFETIKEETIKYGKRNFIEVARKKAIDEDKENLFISLAKGFFVEMGGTEEKRYKKNFALPVNKEVVDFVSEKVKEMLEEEDEGSRSNKESEE